MLLASSTCFPRGAGRQGMGVTVRPSPAPAWAHSHGQFSMDFSRVCYSHGLQFFMSCSARAPFCRVQSFQSHLLQSGFPTGSWQETCSSLGCSLQVCSSLPWGHSSLGHPPAPGWGSPWDAGGSLLPHGAALAAGAQLPHHLSFTLAPPSLLTLVPA